MKNGCNENSEAEIVDRNERAKKLYRYISDVSRRIDDVMAACRNTTELFTPSLEVQRQKLREHCEKLMFLEPTNYGKKSLELLWRKVYYDTVCAAKKFRDTENEYDNYLLTHIVCGIGHFHHLLTRLQTEMKVNFKELDYFPIHRDEEFGEYAGSSPVEKDIQNWTRSTLHSCLMYLGDLSRYQVEIFNTFDPSIAARYYLQASHLNRSSGMPYNQLGNLYMNKNHNLDSVCYYIHCLSFSEPFEGAMGNLQKLFEKNSQFMESLNEENVSNQSQTEHIQTALSRFLSLVEIWYFSKDNQDIPQHCSLTAHDIKICLDFKKSVLPDITKNYDEYKQAIDEENINPSYMNGDIIHKIVLICLFSIAKISETDEKAAFAAKAFTLALLSQLLHKLLEQLQLCGFRQFHFKHRKNIPQKHSKNANDNEEKENIVISNGCSDKLPDAKKENGDISDNDIKTDNLKTKKMQSKRRRRRRVASSSGSDLTETDGENSDVEEISHTDDSKSDSSYSNESEVSDKDNIDTELETISNGNHKIESNGDKNNADNADVTLEKDNAGKKTLAEAELNAVELQKFFRGGNFFASIKLLQDWLLKETDLIISCGESGEPFFQSVVDLVNIFEQMLKHRKPDVSNTCRALDYAKSIAMNLQLEYKRIPLPEDVNLRGTNICKFDRDAAEWNLLNQYKPAVYEENVIRILNFINFGQQIAKIVPRIRYNSTLQVYYMKRTPKPKVNIKLPKVTHKRNKDWHHSKKIQQGNDGVEGGLLRRLGKLWLASRVRELERTSRAHQGPTLLAVDASSLSSHLRLVKQLLRSRTFLILVPSVVLQELDELKREQSTARDAIRWLETQLQRGSRFLRAQRPGQTRPLLLLRCPKKAPQHVHNFIQILEFCHHFVADEKQVQGGDGDPDSTLHAKSAPLLVLLTGTDPGAGDEPYKEFSFTGAARAVGISIESIVQFHSKWKQTMLKNGKKR